MVSDAGPHTAAPEGALMFPEGAPPPADVSPAVGQRVPTLCEAFAARLAEMSLPPFVDSVVFLLQGLKLEGFVTEVTRQELLVFLRAAGTLWRRTAVNDSPFLSQLRVSS